MSEVGGRDGRKCERKLGGVVRKLWNTRRKESYGMEEGTERG